MGKRRRPEIRIGTSGWHYLDWRGRFYFANLPTHEMLGEYARHFDSVEINNSFYKLPTVRSFENWRDSVPEDFIFTVKGSRFVTHMKKLKDPKPALDLLLSRVQGLGSKMGPILFQLPPNWHLNQKRFEEFLEVLPRSYRFAFEFRDPTWHVPTLFRALERRGYAFCIFDIEAFESPEVITSDFVYVRLHGPTRQKYRGSYSGAGLERWVRRIDAWRSRGLDVYFYFDNDVQAAAAYDAEELLEMLGLKSSSSRAA